MNKPFAIIFDNTQNKDKLEIFIDTVRSAYISKKGNNHILLISAPSENTPEEIHNLIKSKAKDEIYFLVTVFDDFFGNLTTDAFAWIKETFPYLTLISDEKPDELKEK